MKGMGIFSPPAMISRTEERSLSSTPGTSRIARTIAGAVHMQVTRDRSISSTTSSASNTRWTTVVAPAAIIVVVMRSSAPTWYSGPQASPTSASVTPSSVMWAKFFQARLAWVIITPFGRPVVPEVYIRRWRSSAPADTRGTGSVVTRTSANRSQSSWLPVEMATRTRSPSTRSAASSPRSSSSSSQTKARAWECSRMNATSAAARRQLIGMAIAPRWLAAKIVSRKSTLLYERSPTTSPAPTPRASSPVANAADRSAICR